MALDPRIREISKLVPGQSRLRGRSRRHPSLATDAQAVARAVWTPCLPQPRPANFAGPAKRRISGSSADSLFAPCSSNRLGFRPFRVHLVAWAQVAQHSLQDDAVAVVADLVRGVESDPRVELHGVAAS